MEIGINELLQRAVALGASDVHLKVGSAPMARVDGELRQLDGAQSLSPDDTQAYVEGILTPKAANDFKNRGTADFAYGRQDLGRFRVSAFRQRGSVSLTLRRVVPGSRSFAELGLPKAAEKVAAADSGLVVVSGPSGSGKTATMASMIDWINTNKGKAIITIEDPIEVLHPDKRSLVAQREVGVDTPDMAGAVRGAMRHDTDVILISELPDMETVRAAIDAAETGHLVISSMRTTDPADTIHRMVSMFPEAERRVVRSQLASQLRAVFSQILVDTRDGGGALICEVLTSNERAREWIMEDRDPALLTEIIKESGFHGMQTFDQALLEQVMAQTIDLDTALPYARNTHELRAKAQSAGIQL